MGYGAGRCTQGVPEPHNGSERGDREVGLHTDTGAVPALTLGGMAGAGATATEVLVPGSEVSSGGGDDFFLGGRGLG